LKITDISLASPDKPDNYRDYLNQALNNTSQRLEMRHRLKNGEICDVDVYSSQIPYQDRNYIYSTAHNITDRKQAESMLREEYDVLESAIKERTSGLIKANERLNSEIAERTQMQDALQQSQELLRELVEHQERIREDERKRIAREIHDELGQHLLVLRIDVSLLKNRKNSAHPKLDERVDALLQHIDSTMKSVRAIINNLRPAVLDLGLTASLEWQAKNFQRLNKIECEFVAEDENLELDDGRATVLFRALQEALTNVIRHAQATMVKIELYRDDSLVIMRVADNGVGMPKVRNRKDKSFGLAGIRERIGMLGGDFTINTCSEGTTLKFSIPL
jgi:signal transduction histidine kinase